MPVRVGKLWSSLGRMSGIQSSRHFTSFPLARTPPGCESLSPNWIQGAALRERQLTMRLALSSEAWEDYPYGRQADERIFRRINDLIKDTKRTHFRALASLNRSGGTCLAGGRDGLRTNTEWHAVPQGRAKTRRRKSRLSGFTIDQAAKLGERGLCHLARHRAQRGHSVRVAAMKLLVSNFRMAWPASSSSKSPIHSSLTASPNRPLTTGSSRKSAFAPKAWVCPASFFATLFWHNS